MKKQWIVCALGVVAVSVASSVAFADAWDPPVGYYAGATGTGATLKTQLTAAMSAGHIQRQYGNYRNMSVIIDADPDVPGNILLVYNRVSVSGNWDSGATWNREHVWPQSRQPGSVNNSSTGNLGDPHALRPANPSINSSRSNKPFGFGTTFGGFGSLGSYYFPGDDDKGDIARQLFYSDTRWTSLGLSLVDPFPSGNQMGELASQVAWHYLDPPDTFERRRNHAIYDIGLNPAFHTDNRSAYVDHPEFVWSVYVDQLNDSQLNVGGAPAADGSSAVAVFQDMLLGASAQSDVVAINKIGDDGTYYEVLPAGDATSTVEGRMNAFEIGSNGDFSTFTIGIDPAAVASIGDTATGTVTIDNLDITTGGGAGVGANDGNDVVSFSVTVLDSSEGSFASGSDQNSVLVDLGTIDQGTGDATGGFTIHNISTTPGFTAGLDVEFASGSGDTGALTTDFATIAALAEGGSQGFTATMSDATIGVFSATYTYNTFDDQIGVHGAQAGADLTLTVIGEVIAGVCDGDANGDNIIDVNDISFVLFRLGDPCGAPGCDGDANGDGTVDVNDISYVLFRLGNPC